MNEQIKQLWDKAATASAAFPSGQNNSWETQVNFMEKFAELIIQECIQASEAHAKDLESQPTDPLLEMYDNGIVSGIYEATEAIKEHFGIKE